MDMYFISLGMLLFSGVFSMFLHDNWKLKFCSLISGISAILLLIPSLTVLFTGMTLSKVIYLSPLFGEVNFVIDALSAFFIIVISVMSFWGVLYSNGYLKPYIKKGDNISVHCLFLMTLISSMLAVATVQNALFFLVVWEIMSLSSFFLVIFEGDKREVLSAGIKYMVYMHICVIFLICAFALANIVSNSLNFADFSIVLSKNQTLANIVFLLAFIGFGTKAGFVPFHNWLPDAHPAAPSHVSGIMSGVMIKTGIYGILRTLCIIGMPSKFVAYTVLIVAVISALYGVLYAITQHDIKRLLAYHSIENIGIIGIGIGIGLLGQVYGNLLLTVLGFSGGILHILNHSIFKELLFFSAGSVYLKTHTKDVGMLGGLIKNMPYTALFFIIGSVAICGLPPFNGFISEFLIYAGMIVGLPAPDTASFITLIVALASLALIGTMAILCFTKATGVMFLGLERSDLAKSVESDVEKIMLLPMGILAIFTLLIGLFPQYILIPVSSAVSVLIHSNQVIIYRLFAGVANIMQVLSVLFLIFLAMVACVGLIKYLLCKNSSKHVTWGCGYDRPNAKMQYSASSYADLFISTLKPMFKRISHIKKPKELFPKEAYYEVEIEEIGRAHV